MDLPVIVIGGGGHARVLVDGLLLKSCKMIGYTEISGLKRHEVIHGVTCIGEDDFILRYHPDEVLLVNGVGSIGSTAKRKSVYDYFKNKGYSFYNFIHPSAIISPTSYLGEGVQIMAGAIIQTGTRIGENSIINTRASVDHDCVIAGHVHLAPAVTLSGGVQVEEGVHIGTGTSVIQQIHIYQDSIIGAGSLVIRDVLAKSTVYGVPAKEVRT